MTVASEPRSESVLGALLHALDEGALVFDAVGICRVVGRRTAEVLGADPATIVGLPRAELLRAVGAATDGPDALLPLEPLASGAQTADAPRRTVVDPIVLSRGIQDMAAPSRPAPRSGHYPRTIVWTSVPLEDGGRLDLIRDVTRERRAEEAVEELNRRLELESTLDDLTGLANLRRFEEDCLREHRRAQREWITYAIACVDIDGMTAINDRFGRAVGDALLRRVGEELKSSRREYDVVARHANDEFVVLLPRADVRALPSVLSRAIAGVYAAGRALLAESRASARASSSPELPAFTVSLGAAIWTPPSAEGPHEIHHRAKAALAAARARGAGHAEIDAGLADWKE